MATAIPVKLQVFEGPLDLLLHLIDTNKIDIYDIPIVEITQQYMDYIREMQKEDLNVVSEFLVMAATLLEIKARMLLPAEVDEEGEEIDPRAELVEQLLEYKKYKYMGQQLKDRQYAAALTFFHGADIPEEVASYIEPVDIQELLGDVTLKQLNEIFLSLLKKSEEKVDPIRSKFGTIEKEEVSLEDKMVFVRKTIGRARHSSFRKLIEGQKSKMHMIVTFLAILELMKTGMITVSQDHTFSDILIDSNEDAEATEEI